jgi:RNA polymerase sigma factor (sigma-70 family)
VVQARARRHRDYYLSSHETTTAGAYSGPVAIGNSARACGHDKEDVELDDATLWSRSRIWDAEALGLLFERHAKAIYNYCFRRLGDWAVAEDTVSLVFLEAWRRREKELPPDKVLPWLYGIATNVLRNRRRSERRFAAALRRMPPPRPVPDFGDAADERLDEERQMRRVLALVSQLPPREQDVFALCGWSEVSYEDAATALGIPVGTVRSRLSRARQRLRELAPEFGHEESDVHATPEAVEP